MILKFIIVSALAVLFGQLTRTAMNYLGIQVTLGSDILLWTVILASSWAVAYFLVTAMVSQEKKSSLGGRLL